VAADEEGRLAILPAFGDIGAARLLADRVQAGVTDERPDFGVVGTVPEPRFDPRRLLLDRGLAVADLQAEELPAFWTNRHATPLPFGLARFARSRAQLITRSHHVIRAVRRGPPPVVSTRGRCPRLGEILFIQVVRLGAEGFGEPLLGERDDL